MLKRAAKIVELLSNGGVYTVAQIAKAIGEGQWDVYYTVKLLAKRGVVDCRVFGARVMLCGDVSKFIASYANAVKKALEDLTAGCRSRCCVVSHVEVLSHPTVARLFYQLGFKTVKSATVQAVSLGIIDSYMNLTLYRVANRVLILACRGAEFPHIEVPTTPRAPRPETLEDVLRHNYMHRKCGEKRLVSFKVSRQLLEDLREYAKLTGRSVSDVVREAIARLLEEWRVD